MWWATVAALVLTCVGWVLLLWVLARTQLRIEDELWRLREEIKRLGESYDRVVASTRREPAPFDALNASPITGPKDEGYRYGAAVAPEGDARRPDAPDGLGVGDSRSLSSTDLADAAPVDKGDQIATGGKGLEFKERGGIPSPSGPKLVPFSEENVRQAYGAWCRDREIPVWLASTEVVPMRFRGERRADELDSPQYVFEDAEGVAEFVRFAPTGEDRGLLFPHPQALFNKNTHGRLFLALDEESWLREGGLAGVEPTWVRRSGSGEWVGVRR